MSRSTSTRPLARSVTGRLDRHAANSGPPWSIEYVVDSATRPAPTSRVSDDRISSANATDASGFVDTVVTIRSTVSASRATVSAQVGGPPSGRVDTTTVGSVMSRLRPEGVHHAVPVDEQHGVPALANVVGRVRPGEELREGVVVE